ncbi:hypothetical protein DFO47_11260 [Arthrobacter sp. AG258]|uniref:hypothetical protein n=1 Tax=Arthrobacter sp. AG258 TaxID=2183899 RepID=UPI001061845A|nr:hypothetical protein [Arthrobacter sp. AG258]TDT74701.1 hypothetical protein DFO47_11260 [Arthrobacter sp. AG258]
MRKTRRFACITAFSLTSVIPFGTATAAVALTDPPPHSSETGVHTTFTQGNLASFNRDNEAGDQDGVQWLPDLHTLVINQPGNYKIAGVVAANIRIDSAPGTVNIYGVNKNVSDQDFDTETERASFFNMRKGGDQGNVAVGPDGDVDAPGYRSSVLTGVFINNPIDPTNPDSVIQASQTNQATINLHNFTILGDGQNAVRPLYGNVDGVMSDLVVITPPFGVSSSRPRGSGGGGVEIGTNGLLQNSFLKVGDDAIKPKMTGSQAKAIRVQLQESGAAVQFGWSPIQAEGNATVTDVTVNGWLKQTANGDTRPGAGESVIGGVIGGNEDNYTATGIHVQPDEGKTFPNIVRLQFPQDPAIPNIQLQLDLAANTTFTNVNGKGATHSFVFIRPDGLTQQTVQLNATQQTPTGTVQITPTDPTYAPYFSVSPRVTVAAN